MNPQSDISVPQLAQRLGCTVPYAQSLIRRGSIRGRKTPRGWVTTPAALEVYLSKRNGAKTAARGDGSH
jgi:hypothetical protein